VSCRRAWVLLALAAALLGSGCGAPPPQAPVAQAQRVASALSGIAAACGQAYQQDAFAPRARDHPALERAASMRVRELAEVVRENPHWIYNGESLQDIVKSSIGYLSECRLARAAALLRATAG
jgi:hypothetical protein